MASEPGQELHVEAAPEAAGPRLDEDLLRRGQPVHARVEHETVHPIAEGGRVPHAQPGAVGEAEVVDAALAEHGPDQVQVPRGLIGGHIRGELRVAAGLSDQARVRELPCDVGRRAVAGVGDRVVSRPVHATIQARGGRDSPGCEADDVVGPQQLGLGPGDPGRRRRAVDAGAAGVDQEHAASRRSAGARHPGHPHGDRALAPVVPVQRRAHVRTGGDRVVPPVGIARAGRGVPVAHPPVRTLRAEGAVRVDRAGVRVGTGGGLRVGADEGAATPASSAAHETAIRRPRRRVVRRRAGGSRGSGAAWGLQSSGAESRATRGGGVPRRGRGCREWDGGGVGERRKCAGGAGDLWWGCRGVVGEAGFARARPGSASLRGGSRPRTRRPPATHRPWSPTRSPS